MRDNDHGDPTAIPLRTDPRRQRISGMTVHGSHAFDMPLITRIADNLWQGGCEDGLMLPPIIDHLVSLYPWERYDMEQPLKSSLFVEMHDALVRPDLDQIRAIAEWVNACRRTGETLVHCQAGLNRSGLVVAYALMLEGMAAGDAIDLLRTQRSPAVLCNTTFEAWLREQAIESLLRAS